MKNKKIAVVMGGPSSEREVSLNTGRAILTALREKGYTAVGVDLDPPNFIEQLKQEQIDVVFNAIHGLYGEDGLMQGTLEMLGIPYTGSGVLASAMAMDKAITKRLFMSAGIPTPQSRLYSKQDTDLALVAEDILTTFGVPVVVKAAAQGSSIGVIIVEKAGDIESAVREAFNYSGHIVVEEFIRGKELTVSILGTGSPEALPIIEIVPQSGRYDYRSKYTKGATEYIVPARLETQVADHVQRIALAAYKLLGCRGIGRVDVMLGNDNQPHVLEINTIPGMTATSLVPKAAAAVGIGFDELCERILLMVAE
ncbi:D-alanine--D-alanine ligase family protein [Sporomusa sphaeroides]|uniref:D-alanine--D-alanine ligase n=2 Tax=Sporomusa TaxID=2375 RepID=A0ABM9VYV7_9FIRM|nr:D-alanine--D-alanine ligase [Sporomusa sphaeroides]OLS58079.1 D-alanine--D-alanine ligase B [Sporomusa sphaeroides DSM 2875]CVK17734.1 D-alanine--D-alanine ligase B [Sporomusa sphaeroides DSM 2875]SCM80542.1 D-alanine:D-alanine ligase [uncultured Sporomusa sp.]HML31413.1 D-alanine--D-alanine ligase [Sporomusa sphaeroides]